MITGVNLVLCGIHPPSPAPPLSFFIDDLDVRRVRPLWPLYGFELDVISLLSLMFGSLHLQYRCNERKHRGRHLSQ